MKDNESVRKELGEWETWRNGSIAGIKWQFTTADASRKLSSLYPKFDMKDETRVACIISNIIVSVH